MVEILVLIAVCKYIGGVMRNKGRNPLGHQIMAIVFYLVGAFVGGFVYGIYLANTGSAPTEPFDPLGIVLAVAGGGVGIMLAIGLAKSAAPGDAISEVQDDEVDSDVPNGRNPYNPNNGDWIPSPQVN